MRPCIAIALAALVLSACLQDPGTRQAGSSAALASSSYGGSGSSSSSSSSGGSSSSSSSGGSTAQYTITGTAGLDQNMQDGQVIKRANGLPANCKAFLVGLPAVQAGISSSDGSFTLNITAAEAAAAGFGDGSNVTLIAWCVATPFAEVVAAQAPVHLGAGMAALNLTLTWAMAYHVTVTVAGAPVTLSSVTAVGIDDPAQSFAMARVPGVFGNSFDTNYLPPGSYQFRLDTTGGQMLLKTIYMDAASAAGNRDQWEFPTYDL